MGDAPTPASFDQPGEAALATARDLAARHRFFHWELEFPDVFRGVGSGFDAVLGNPPWEIQKPNSKEFFLNLDPLYRTYGKQEALRRQRELFTARAADEHAWLTYNAHFKALSNWNQNAARPFGENADGGGRFYLGGGSEQLHTHWARRRERWHGYADAEHPFRHQGSADINTYKMFLEQARALLRPGGRLGLIVPSGVYTDKGTSDLRRVFLEDSDWRWLFGFENRWKIFDIDGRFKFAPVIVAKTGRTDAVRAAFMHHDLADWEDAERHVVPYQRAQVERFSPHTLAILEVRTRRDIEVLEKIYASSVLLGDDGPGGWGIKYATELHMTNDSKLFPPRPQREAKGYRPDEYGRWVGPEGDVALPLYEGRMIGQFDFSAKGWVSGKGRTAVWRAIPWDAKVVEPQYLMAATTYSEYGDSSLTPGTKTCFMDVSSATNRRARGIAAFTRQHDGDGWMLPETLCLADLALGHDERARKPQPVRARLGERFLPWQLEQTPEESWAECERHARNLLGETEFRRPQRELAAEECEARRVAEERGEYRVDGGSGAGRDDEGQERLWEETCPPQWETPVRDRGLERTNEGEDG